MSPSLPVLILSLVAVSPMQTAAGSPTSSHEEAIRRAKRGLLPRRSGPSKVVDLQGAAGRRLEVMDIARSRKSITAEAAQPPEAPPAASASQAPAAKDAPAVTASRPSRAKAPPAATASRVSEPEDASEAGSAESEAEDSSDTTAPQDSEADDASETTASQDSEPEDAPEATASQESEPADAPKATASQKSEPARVEMAREVPPQEEVVEGPADRVRDEAVSVSVLTETIIDARGRIIERRMRRDLQLLSLRVVARIDELPILSSERLDDGRIRQRVEFAGASLEVLRDPVGRFLSARTAPGPEDEDDEGESDED